MLLKKRPGTVFLLSLFAGVAYAALWGQSAGVGPAPGPSSTPSQTVTQTAPATTAPDTAVAATGDQAADADAKPVEATDAKGKKKKKKKEKKPKLYPVFITNGILTVDGYTGKARMNYDIPDIKFLYIWAPDIGTTIISNVPFPKAKEQPKAFDQYTLTVTVDTHVLQVSSDKFILGKLPLSAWVLVDPEYNLPARFPVMGYGTITVPPYGWPGSKPVPKRKKGIEPPPLPAGLSPVLIKPPVPGAAVKSVPPSAPTEAAKPAEPSQ